MARKYQVAFAGSVTINDGVHLVGNTRVPAIAEHYARGVPACCTASSADVFVAQHGAVFALEDKARRAGSCRPSNPFVDPDGYQRFVDARRAGLPEAARPRISRRGRQPSSLRRVGCPRA